MKRRLQELCECAFEQGYTKLQHESKTFKLLPSLTIKQYEILKDILKEQLKKEMIGE